MSTNRKLRVFLCHASQDKPAVRKFYSKLSSVNWVDVWLDEEKLLPGQDWSLEIEKAVETTDVVIVFISTNSVNKEGYVQKELRLALDIADEKPEGTIFVVPVRLDDNSSAPRRLQSLQWVDLFDNDGYQKLLKALEVRYKSISAIEKKSAQYNLDVVNELLLKLPDSQLRSLVYEELSPLFDRINWGGYLFSTVSAIIMYAQKEDKVSNIVEWCAKNVPSTYDDYSSRLNFLPSSGGTENIAVFGNENVINIGRIDATRRFRNPYVTGNPIQPTNSRVFWGRLDIAESIIREIRDSHQKPSFLLYGRRRMGKTSALLNLRRLIRGIKIIDVLISGQNSKFHNDIDFCFHVVDKIIQTTKENLAITTFFQEYPKYSNYDSYSTKPSLTLSLFFDQYNSFLEKNDLYCLLMLDEYEEFGGLSRQLLLQLRDTLQHMPRLIFIFSGISHVDELPNPYWSEVFINVRTLKISFLQRSDGYKLLTEPVPELIYENPKIIERILDITGCQPFLLQAIAAELVNRLNLSSKLAVSNKDLDLAVVKVFSSWKNYFDGYIWKKECSTDVHRNIMQKILREKKVSKNDLGNYQKQVNELVERDLLKKQNDYWQYTMPILGMWLEQANLNN